MLFIDFAIIDKMQTSYIFDFTNINLYFFSSVYMVFLLIEEI